MPVIDTAREREGIEKAVLDLLEESFTFACVRRSLDFVDDETAARMLDMPERMLSPSYYKLGEFLLWLADLLEIGAASNDRLTADELEGLRALAAAKREFESRHPKCGACGTRQESKFSPSCRECGAEFTRKK
jgi:hypothetical protein